MNIKNYIPSFITCLNLACGFLVLIVEPTYGIYLILLGGIFDVFDGLVARLLKAESEIGGQLDSMADMVTFGIAPAYLVSLEFSTPYNYLSIIIVVTAAIRLAKFNISGGEQYYFLGLAVPSSAMFYVGLVHASHYGLTINPYLMLLLVGIVALLNVSTVKMFSFKGLKKDKLTTPFLAMTILAGLIVCFYNWHWSLIFGMITYIILSLVYHWRLSNE